MTDRESLRMCEVCNLAVDEGWTKRIRFSICPNCKNGKIKDFYKYGSERHKRNLHIFFKIASEARQDPKIKIKNFFLYGPLALREGD